VTGACDWREDAYLVYPDGNGIAGKHAHVVGGIVEATEELASQLV